MSGTSDTNDFAELSIRVELHIHLLRQRCLHAIMQSIFMELYLANGPHTGSDSSPCRMSGHFGGGIKNFHRSYRLEAVMNRTNATPPAQPFYPHPSDRDSPPRVAGEKHGRGSDSSSNDGEPSQRQRRASPNNHSSAIVTKLMESWRQFEACVEQSATQDTGRNAAEAIPTSSVTADARPIGVVPLPEQYASRSLRKWAEDAYQQVMALDNISLLLARDERGNFVNEPALNKACFDIAYRLYAHMETGENTLNRAQQEQFLRELETISEGAECEVIAQYIYPNDGLLGLSPLAALNHNADLATATHYYVRPLDMDTRPSNSADGSQARLTLTVSPQYVIPTGRRVVPMLEQFADIINHFKITSPRGQGKRTDSIVIYLNQANIERVNQLAAHLSTLMTSDAWDSRIPRGMHPLGTGIAYAEFSRRAASGSFGEDRARMLTDALIHSIKSRRTLERCVKDAVVARGYSLENPALIARTR